VVNKMVNKMRSRLVYKFAKYPNNQNINEIIDSALRLEKKLSFVNIDEISISEYNSRYFGNYINTAEDRILNLQKYCYILSWALEGLNKHKKNVILLDHGGGHGMMSLLAKEHGIGTVIHNDIYPISSEDACKIGEFLNIRADTYVPGTIDDVIQYLNQNNMECDAIVSYDVIEHIYDIDDFLQKLHLLSPGRMSVFMGSAANERNPFIDHRLKSMHRIFENRDRAPKYGRKPTDATRAIKDLRREIIVKCSFNLSVDEIESLTGLTRGMVVNDIHEVVEEYCKARVYPKPPLHPTNTCDPYTGNWFEHLMDPDQLVKTLNATGFDTKVVSGYYNSPKNIPIKIIKSILNLIIRMMRKKGLFFAPYFILMARK
jgi:2-polyprenyl-3-methyl-5-hydroxy-6-metoxy-1,4-benzoquinol methylase